MPVRLIQARACQPSSGGSACRTAQPEASTVCQLRQYRQQRPNPQAVAAKQVQALERAAVCHILCQAACLYASCKAATFSSVVRAQKAALLSCSRTETVGGCAF